MHTRCCGRRPGSEGGTESTGCANNSGRKELTVKIRYTVQSVAEATAELDGQKFEARFNFRLKGNPQKWAVKSAKV